MPAFSVAAHLDFYKPFHISIDVAISVLRSCLHMFIQFLETTHDGEIDDDFLSCTVISHTSILSSHCLVRGVCSVL